MNLEYSTCAVLMCKVCDNQAFTICHIFPSEALAKPY